MPSGLIIRDVKDALAAALQILESAQEEVLWLIPASINSLSITQGFVEKVRKFIQGGGVSRGVVSILPDYIAEIRTFLAAGEDIRHSDKVCEVFMYIGDKRESISSINIGVEEYTLNTPVTAFWSEDPTYAAYLLASFESVWAHAAPADERIRELIKQEPQQADLE